MKGGGCGCSSGSLLGFPQAGGQNVGTMSPPQTNTTMPRTSSLGMMGQTNSPRPRRSRRMRNTSATMPSQSMDTMPSQNMPTMPSQNMPTMPSQNMPTMPSQNMATMPSQNMATMPSQNMPSNMGSNPASRNQVTRNNLQQLQSQLNSLNTRVNSMPTPSTGLFGGSQKGGFLGLFESPKNEIPTNQIPPTMNSVAPPMMATPSTQDIVKMPAVSATNSGSANERIRNLEQRLAAMESKGGYALFGGRRRRSTRKIKKSHKKRKSSRK